MASLVYVVKHCLLHLHKMEGTFFFLILLLPFNMLQRYNGVMIMSNKLIIDVGDGMHLASI